MLRFIGWWRRSLCKYGDRVAGHQHRAERQRRTNKSLHLDFLPPAWGVVRFMQNPSYREARLGRNILIVIIIKRILASDDRPFQTRTRGEEGKRLYSHLKRGET